MDLKEQNKVNTTTGARALVDALLREGIDHVFGIPGTQNLAVIDALRDTPQIRFILRSLLLFAAAAAFAGSTAAASIAEAQRIVDRAAPLHCEILALEKRLQLADAGTEEYAGLTAEIAEANKRLKMLYLATMSEYIAVMKELPFEERKAVYAYSDAVAGRCAAKAGRDVPDGANGNSHDKRQAF